VEGAENLLNKMPDVAPFKNFDIIVFTETFLKVNYDLLDFYSAHLHAIQGMGGRPSGGISCYVNPRLGQILSINMGKNYVIVTLRNFCIISFYLNPSLNETDVHEVILEAFSKAPTDKTIIMTGDFNCRIDINKKTGKMHNKGVAIIKTMSLLNLKMCNNPDAKTYIAYNGSSTIDLLFYNPNHFVFMSQEFSKFYSAPLKKHQPVLFKLEFLYKKQDEEYITSNKSIITNKINCVKLHHIFQKERKELDNLISEGQNVDEVYKKLQYCILESAEPKKIYTNKAKPWFDEEAFLLRKHILDILYQLRYCNFNNKDLLEYYSYLQKLYRKVLFRKQHEYQEKYEEKLVILAENAPYTYLRKENIVNVQCPISLHDWETHFKSIYNCNNYTRSESLDLLYLVESYESDLNFEIITSDEIIRTLTKMKNNKAAGHDYISKEHWEEFCKECSPFYFASLFNMCIKNRKLPDIWKKSLLKVLYKGKGDIMSPNSYRGIAICIIMLKLFDKILCNRLFKCTKDLIPDVQFGFMPKRSTVQAVKYLHAKILKDTSKPRSFTYVIFIDFLKAFDLVDRQLLLQKLINTKRLAKDLLVAIALLLDVNYVIVNDGLLLSTPILQSNGVLQGGPSSPLLYNLLTHDVINIIAGMIDEDPDIFISIYADDIAILCKDLEKLQKLMDKLVEWAALNGLKINASKTKILKFKFAAAGRPKLNPPSEDIFCNGEKLEYVNSYKYLGVTFQQSGKSFARHIIDKSKKAISAAYSISNLNLLSLKTAIKLFNMKVSPVASYGIEVVWPYLSLTDFENLEKVKSNYLKRALCLSKYTKNRLVYELTGEKFFINELQAQFNLPITENYLKFINKRIEKSENICLSFYNAFAFKDQKWKEPNRRNRHVVTRFAVHGFHHIVCSTKEFHESNKDCKCKLCGERCEQYHLLECKERRLSLTQIAVGEC
jgi:Reverse transcriptase (RNA-dependent DNA polymerase)/Endonuclease-reverse transcriptase